MTEKNIGIKVTVQRDYGVTTVTFEGYELNVPFEGASISYDLMTTKVFAALDHFEAHTLPHLRASKATTNMTTIESPANKIVVSMDKGKKRYNVIGGKFTQFGVPFYEEHMKEGGINPAEISDDGEELPAHSVMIIETEGGKAKRVLRIEQR